MLRQHRANWARANRANRRHLLTIRRAAQQRRRSAIVRYTTPTAIAQRAESLYPNVAFRELHRVRREASALYPYNPTMRRRHIHRVYGFQDNDEAHLYVADTAASNIQQRWRRYRAARRSAIRPVLRAGASSSVPVSLVRSMYHNRGPLGHR